MKNTNEVDIPAIYLDLTYKQRKWVLEEYIGLQEGKCSFCEESLEETPEMGLYIEWRLIPGGRDTLNDPIHLHNCQDTGLTLGAVHAYCNAVLWQYRGTEMLSRKRNRGKELSDKEILAIAGNVETCPFPPHLVFSLGDITAGEMRDRAVSFARAVLKASKEKEDE